MSKEPKTKADYQSGYERRQAEKGMARVAHWVPDTDNARSTMKSTAARLRAEHKEAD